MNPEKESVPTININEATLNKYEDFVIRKNKFRTKSTQKQIF